MIILGYINLGAKKLMADWKNFYKLTWNERVKKLVANKALSETEQQLIESHFDAISEQQIENYLYSFGVPTGLLTELLVDGKLVSVPMTTEEPSVIAAANNGARMIRAGSGIKSNQLGHQVRGQIIVTDLVNQAALLDEIKKHKDLIIDLANQAYPSMLKRGGGAQDILVEGLNETTVIVNILVNPCAAMGANVVNTMAEAVASYLRELGYQVLMAILSNLATEALTELTVAIPVDALVTKTDFDGRAIAKRIMQASQVERLSAHRAVTSNKGLMNGIDAAVLASGNDTRSVSAALHAYAASSGHYQGLVNWQLVHDELVGKMTVPLLLGTVGGSIKIVPAVKLNHAIMGNPSVTELTAIIGGVGLAQNLAALRALVTVGIQAGHMALQAKSLALAVGAVDSEVPILVKKLQAQGHFDSNTAKKILDDIRE